MTSMPNIKNMRLNGMCQYVPIGENRGGTIFYPGGFYKLNDTGSLIMDAIMKKNDPVQSILDKCKDAHRDDVESDVRDFLTKAIEGGIFVYAD